MNLGECSVDVGFETIVDGGSPVCSFMSSHSMYVNKTAGFERLCFFFVLEEGWNYIQKRCDDVLCCCLWIEHIQVANVVFSLVW